MVDERDRYAERAPSGSFDFALIPRLLDTSIEDDLDLLVRSEPDEALAERAHARAAESMPHVPATLAAAKAKAAAALVELHASLRELPRPRRSGPGTFIAPDRLGGAQIDFDVACVYVQVPFCSAVEPARVALGVAFRCLGVAAREMGWLPCDLQSDRPLDLEGDFETVLDSFVTAARQHQRTVDAP